MSETTRRTSGRDRLASANLNRLEARDGETDLGVRNCEPAIENDRLSLLRDIGSPRYICGSTNPAALQGSYKLYESYGIMIGLWPVSTCETIGILCGINLVE